MGYKVMILIDAETAAKEFMVLAKEPDYQHEGEDWRSGLYMAEDALSRVPAVDVDQIFADIESAMRLSKVTHVGQQFYGLVLETCINNIKKKYGVK